LSQKLPAWTRALLILLTMIVLASLLYANYRFVLQSPGGNDFLARWMGAKSWIVDGINPYDPRVGLRSQGMIYGRPAKPEEGEDLALFVYPLPAMIFFAPFGLLPYAIARTIWMTMLEIALPIITLIGIRISGWKPSNALTAILLLFSVIWYHGIRAIVLGQFAVIEALLIAAALLAIQRNRNALAGLLLALSISKPPMSFLIIPFILFWAFSNRRWSLISWTVGFLVLIVGLSLLIMPDWPLRWIREVITYPAYSPAKPPITVIAEFFPHGSSSWINMALTGIFLVYAIWEWILAWGKEDRWFQWTAAMTLLISSITVFRTATTSYLVMVPGMMLIFGAWAERWKKGGMIAVIISLFILLVGLWLLFIATIEGNQEHAIMYFPLPLFVLFGLWWTRWWYVRPRRYAIIESE
jgi:hypothetical protein